MITRVELSKGVRKSLRSVPKHIATKFAAWVSAIETFGLEVVRVRPGYHDEPLHGALAGSRSIRLSNAYRAYYRIEDDGSLYVNVIDVDKHLYRE